MDSKAGRCKKSARQRTCHHVSLALLNRRKSGFEPTWPGACRSSRAHCSPSESSGTRPANRGVILGGLFSLEPPPHRHPDSAPPPTTRIGCRRERFFCWAFCSDKIRVVGLESDNHGLSNASCVGVEIERSHDVPASYSALSTRSGGMLCPLFPQISSAADRWTASNP
jgi:hypothetical protein